MKDTVKFGLLMGIALVIKEYVSLLTGNLIVDSSENFFLELVTLVIIYLGILFPVKLGRDMAEGAFKFSDGFVIALKTLAIGAVVYAICLYVFFKLFLTDGYKDVIKESFEEIEGINVDFWVQPAGLTLGYILSLIINGFFVALIIAFLFRKRMYVAKK